VRGSRRAAGEQALEPLPPPDGKPAALPTDQLRKFLGARLYRDGLEVVAEELSQLADKLSGLEERLAEVERVNARLEDAALSTARALGEVSRHWDAVYDAMRRANRIDQEISSERNHDAARARRSKSSV
jgi:hypothetical protein